MQQYFIIVLFAIFSLSSCNLGYNTDGDNITYTYMPGGGGFTVKTVTIKGADAATFKILSNDTYAKDKNRCYFESRPIENAEPKSFIPLEGGFSKDAKNVFYLLRKFKNVDAKSFDVIETGPFSQDKDNIYFYWKSIGVEDYKSFEVINALGGIDNKCYYRTYKAGDSLHINKNPIKDKNSFQILEHRYSKDNQQVYFDGDVVQGADSKTFNVTSYGKGKDSRFMYYGKSRISSPASYKELASGYSMDSLSVYFQWAAINDANPEKFEIINQFWSSDDSNIYLEGEKAEFIDYKTFEHIGGKYVKDVNHVFYLNTRVEHANTKTAEITETWDWLKDDKSYFFEGQEIVGIDYSSFKILNNDYSIDKNQVYFRLKPIKDVDLKSFQTTKYTYGGKDKFNKYYQGKKQ
jgi:hypothetical protein